MYTVKLNGETKTYETIDAIETIERKADFDSLLKAHTALFLLDKANKCQHTIKTIRPAYTDENGKEFAEAELSDMERKVWFRTADVFDKDACKALAQNVKALYMKGEKESTEALISIAKAFGVTIAKAQAKAIVTELLTQKAYTSATSGGVKYTSQLVTLDSVIPFLRKLKNGAPLVFFQYKNKTQEEQAQSAPTPKTINPFNIEL